MNDLYANEVRPGTDDPLIRMKGCPDCGGWGWFCSNPFASFNRTYYQCATCKRAKAHHAANGELPKDIAERMSEGGGREPNLPGGGAALPDGGKHG